MGKRVAYHLVLCHWLNLLKHRSTLVKYYRGFVCFYHGKKVTNNPKFYKIRTKNLIKVKFLRFFWCCRLVLRNHQGALKKLTLLLNFR